MAALTPQVTQFYPAAYCARLENLDPRELLKRGLSSDGLDPTAAELVLGLTKYSIADQALSLATKGYVEFELKCQTETNDTVTTFNLTDLGVDFVLPAAAAAFRRVQLDAFVTSDADVALLKRDAVVVCATTPIVNITTLTFQVTDAGGANQQIGQVGSGGSVISSGDFWAGAGANAILPVILLEQSGNKIRVSFTGVSNIDMFWTIRVRVYPKISQTFPVTD
jgi:hypothetical protein